MQQISEPIEGVFWTADHWKELDLVELFDHNYEHICTLNPEDFVHPDNEGWVRAPQGDRSTRKNGDVETYRLQIERLVPQGE